MEWFFGISPYEAADAASDVWERVVDRLRTALRTKGLSDRLIDHVISGEVDPSRCEAIVHHGPGHQSASQCVYFVHPDENEHYTDEPGYTIYWTDERPFA